MQAEKATGLEKPSPASKQTDVCLLSQVHYILPWNRFLIYAYPVSWLKCGITFCQESKDRVKQYILPGLKDSDSLSLSWMKQNVYHPWRYLGNIFCYILIP